ncbi:hypothetical protein [Halolamina sp. C58]|uniref:hypothetical protein n=1 Tax=Halolamina sp. C58 TaxID=3421640 RepID=UPI003EBAF834
MTVEELSEGLIAKSLPQEHLENLKEDVKENDDVLAVIDNETKDSITVILSLAHLQPDLQYFH